MKRVVYAFAGTMLAVLLLQACSASRLLPEDGYLLDRVVIRSDSASLSPAPLQGYIRQHPNSKWFSLMKVPLGIYCLSGRDSTKRINRFVRRIGEAPVVYDSRLAQKTRQNIESAVQNLGYLDADVEMQERRHKHKVGLLYQIHPRERYSVRLMQIDVQDRGVDSVMRREGDRYHTMLESGMDFDLNRLDAERSRLSSYLLNRGYYRFHKDFVHFEADTTIGRRRVDLQMQVRPYHSGTQIGLRPHQQYRVGAVDYRYETEDGRPFVRSRVIRNATELHAGDLYRESDVQDTYARLMRLGAVQSVNIRFAESAQDSTMLRPQISLFPSKRNTFNVEPQGTNSAGDFGAALSLSYQNRNTFRGSEAFNVKLRGAFEAIKGLSGYIDQDYIEYGAEMGLAFPDFRFPFLSEQFRHAVLATSEVSLMFDLQDRPEFHRRVVTAAWRYRWSGSDRRRQNRVDLLDLDYVFMPWISSTFRERYLDNPTSRNAILRYIYEDLFIMKWGYSFTYSSQLLNGASLNYGTNAYTLRGGIETSGNLLYGISQLFHTASNKKGQYTLFNIAYAQYVKGDFDFSKSFRIDARNSLALHFGFGIAYPYGNTTILPYEKRYFSGGANSVRGWSVRGLGPGSFQGTDGRIDFINQTGDMKLDMNVEYRSHLFWKLDGAFFVDGGNIWTLREYAEQPGGQFRPDKFYKQIAVAYGLGLRLNFDYFILRLDGGMKAIHPAYTDTRHHYPLLYPDFGRDFNLHFAVGLPF
ncbi:MAG: BamA/TamA family outer membrane protein [Bacteroidaceae bacterium]|nr:BamA/TamA family outer membrane protein [Bacteroidaceae bacterium]